VVQGLGFRGMEQGSGIRSVLICCLPLSVLLHHVVGNDEGCVLQAGGDRNVPENLRNRSPGEGLRQELEQDTSGPAGEGKRIIFPNTSMCVWAYFPSLLRVRSPSECKTICAIRDWLFIDEWMHE